MCAERAERRVERPALPAVAWLTAGLWVGVALGDALAWRAMVAHPQTRMATLGLAAAAIVLPGGIAWWSRLRASGISLTCLGLIAGLAIGGLYWSDLARVGAIVRDSRESAMRVEAVSNLSTGAFGSSSLVRAQIGGRQCVLKAQWPKNQAAPLLGQNAKVFGSIVPSQAVAIQRDAFNKGVAGALRVRRVSDAAWTPGGSGLVGRVRAWADARIMSLRAPGGALLASTLLGERWRVAGTADDDAMRLSGLAHFESTSGYHVVLVATCLEALLLAISVGPRARAAALLALLGGFVLLAGGRVSAARSWGVAAAASAARVAGRRSSGLAALALTAAVFICASPPVVFDLGFQMSVAGMVGILVFARLVEAWLCAAVPTIPRWVASPVGLTLCAVAATYCLSAAAFGVLSLVAPLSNVVAAPFVLAQFGLGAVGLLAAAVWSPAGNLMLRGASASGAVLTSIATRLAALPHAAVPVAPPGWMAVASVTIGGSLLWALWPQPRRLWARAALVLGGLALLLVVWMPLPAGRGASVVVMDVGQGDAILVRDGSHALLVDTGPDANHILAALARNGVRKIDGVVITHLHADHFGGMKAAASVIRIPQLFLPAGAQSKPSRSLAELKSEAQSIDELQYGDVLREGSLELDVLSPAGPVENAATNEASVVMVVREGAHSVLLTGDAESGVLAAADRRAPLPRVDVLKVGHHGSAISLDAALLGELQPRVAVISVGVGNRYGHPKPKCLAILAQAGVPVRRTDLEGDVTIAFGADGVKVSASKHWLFSQMAPASRRPASQCAKLSVQLVAPVGLSCRLPLSETHDRNTRRSQVRLPHLRNRGPPLGSGHGEASQARGRGGRPRLQLRHVRRRVGKRRRRGRRV